MSSQEEDLSHNIPRHLDTAGKFLWWDIDVAGIGLAGLTLGLFAGYLILGLILGVVFAYGYGRFKSGKHPGIAAHYAYWWLGTPQPRSLPPSFLRELNG